MLGGDDRDGQERNGPCLSNGITLLILLVMNNWVEPLVSDASVQCGVGQYLLFLGGLNVIAKDFLDFS